MPIFRSGRVCRPFSTPVFIKVYLNPPKQKNERGEEYTPPEVLHKDPFQVIDFDGVGGLMRMGVEKGRSTRKDLKIGICGEHGGEPDSVKFCHKIGLNYVSCSPFRVPIARLAAAQAALMK